MTQALGLFTDLYELTMAASFHRERRDEPVTFDLFVRSLPRQRPFLVVAGIHTAVERLQAFTFDELALAYLGSLGLFDDVFLELPGGVPLHRRGAAPSLRASWSSPKSRFCR